MISVAVQDAHRAIQLAKVESEPPVPPGTPEPPEINMQTPAVELNYPQHRAAPVSPMAYRAAQKSLSPPGTAEKPRRRPPMMPSREELLSGAHTLLQTPPPPPRDTNSYTRIPSWKPNEPLWLPQAVTVEKAVGFDGVARVPGIVRPVAAFSTREPPPRPDSPRHPIRRACGMSVSTTAYPAERKRIATARVNFDQKLRPKVAWRAAPKRAPIRPRLAETGIPVASAAKVYTPSAAAAAKAAAVAASQGRTMTPQQEALLEAANRLELCGYSSPHHSAVRPFGRVS